MKNFKNIIPLVVISFLMAAITACTKDAGEGGTSTITGKVTVYNYNDNAFTYLEDTFPSVDEDVFIIYGDESTTFDDDVKTSYDGTYEFKYLQKGKYRIFAYSEDSTGRASGTAGSFFRPDVPIFIDVEITSKNQTVVGPDIFILTTQQ
ncbi:MAG: hypothetical protein KBF35_10115 [Saprospiraceae bacterium]|nr:hypothetical protein [Saprospiraceae bacterium]